MNIKERVMQIIGGEVDMEKDSIEKLVKLAYYMGKEEAAKETSDRYNDVLAEQIKRAEDERYHNVAMRVQGDIKKLYSSDYRGEMTKTFADDETKF